MLDFAFGFWKTKLNREIVKAKTHNRKSKNSKLQQRRGEIEIISPFCVSIFSGFRLSLTPVFFFCIFAGRRVAEWSRRWTLNHDVDTVVGSILMCVKGSKIYRTVWTIQKYTTLSGQIKNIPHCLDKSGIFLNCPDSVVYFWIVQTVWYIFELSKRGKIDTHNRSQCSLVSTHPLPRLHLHALTIV
jgi:hypothetical protein